MADIAFGYTELEHLFANRIADVNGGAQLNNTAIDESVAAYNQRFNAIVGTLVDDVTIGMEFFGEPTGGTLQPLDEFGNPLPVKKGLGWQNGYPINGAGTAFGDNRLSREMMTFNEANQMMVDAQNRDRNWNKRRIIAAALTSTPYQFFDETRDLRYPQGLGSVTVNSLANGDTVLYTRRDGSSATNNHYLSQAAVISDAAGANPFQRIWEELNHHPSNYGKRIVVYVAQNLVDSIGGLASFVERRDPDVTYPDNVFQTSNETGNGFGDQYVGYVRAPAFCHVVSWGDLPNNYMLATVEGVRPIARRQYAMSTLQDLITERHSPDGNLMITRLLRYAGYGIRNRVGALVYQVNTPGAYVNPAEYTAPLAI